MDTKPVFVFEKVIRKFSWTYVSTVSPENFVEEKFDLLLLTFLLSNFYYMSVAEFDKGDTWREVHKKAQL